MKAYIKKSLALILSAILVFSVIPTAVLAADAENGNLTFGVMSDLHYYPRSLMGSSINEFIKVSKLSSSTSYLSEALLDAALAEYKIQAKEKGLKYIIVPGDLSRNGEYEALKALAEKLKAFEEETGVQVLVINGNHDINNANASRFSNGKFSSTRYTKPEEFRELFADFGYDLADSFYTPPSGEKAGQLSYAATLEGGYRLIAIDGGCYSSDSTSDGEEFGETRGAFSEGVQKWVLNETKKAKTKGLTVIGMTHFNLVEHYKNEDCTMQAFVIDDWQEISEKLANAGMHYAFTGHLHFHDISQLTSDEGETLTDCSTASLVNYPNYFRVVNMDNTSDGEITVNFNTYDCDRTKQISAYGTKYKKPYKYTAFSLNYGGSDIADFADRYAEYFLKYTVCPDVKKAGGFYNYLNALVDIDSLLDSLLDNTDLGKLDGITKSALKSFVMTVCSQLEKKYIDNPDYAVEVVDRIVRKLTAVQVSDYACTKFIKTLGFGSKYRPGNLGDAISSVLAYMYTGDEDRSNDVFLNDVIARFERGENAQVIFDTLVDIVLNDLLKDELLPALEIDPLKFFGALSKDQKIDVLESVFSSLDNAVGSNTPKVNAGNIVTAVLALGIGDINSLEDLLHHFLDEYMTDSQMDTIAYEFYNYLYDFTTDSAPADLNTTIIYSGKKEVIPTVEDLRLPSGIAVTLGADASTSRNISWYTKVSVKETDIEIVPYSENPVFTGIPTSSGIKSKTVRTQREYPGIDFGIFGILGFTFSVNRHEIEITGLKPGAKYCYRVGDASKKWWSDVGVIETSDNSDEFTFLHMSDSQAGIEKQYKVWGETVSSAYELYPNSAFIMHTGDQVDSGTNFKQWNWSLNCASSSIMNSALMPTAGNHEKTGSSVTNNFMLSNIPKQNLETGVYYSFDYNNAHFMVLNTNDVDDKEGLGKQQLEWLKKDAKASKKQWKIVALHKAVYSNGSHFDDDDVKALRTQLASLMPELDIDIVLQGHDHVYLRTDAMKNNEIVEYSTKTFVNNGSSYQTKIKADGTVYAIDGCAGVKYYQTKDASATDKEFPRAEKLANSDSPVFSAIQIKGDKLFFDAYKVEDGKNIKIDSFALSKSNAKNLTSVDGSGDVNGDGVVSIADAKLILKNVSGIVKLNNTQKKAADLNNSNSISIVDAKYVLQLVAGIR